MGVCESSTPKDPNENASNMNTPVSKLDPSIAFIGSISKSLCIIEIESSFYSGFLMQLFKEGEEFFCLITSGHIITDEMLRKRIKLKFYYDIRGDISSNKFKEIYLSKDERYIKDFKDINIDIIAIQILSKDNIEKDLFLLPDIRYMNNYNELKNKDIIILYYSENQFHSSDGKINEMNKYLFTHSAISPPGALGSPIFLKNSKSVIGMFKEGNEEKKKENKEMTEKIMDILLFLY